MVVGNAAVPVGPGRRAGDVVNVSGAGTPTAGAAKCGLAMSISGVNVANICYVGLLSAAECSSSNAEIAADSAEQQAALPGSSFVFTSGCLDNPHLHHQSTVIFTLCYPTGSRHAIRA